jgi:cardiolipin synthase
LVPIFVLGALRAQELARSGIDLGLLRWSLVSVLALIALSDVLDGWIARRYGLASQLGAIMDALADKLAQVAFVAVFALATGPAFEALPLWFLALVLARDLVLGGGWLALKVRAVPFQVVHRMHGRATTAAVFAVLFWVTAGLGDGGLAALVLLAAALIWVSTAAYVFDAWKAAHTSTKANAGVLP